jgi:hypothetical protein
MRHFYSRAPASMPDASKLEETVVLAQRSCSMQTVHYATVGFLIACMVWAAVMVLYKARCFFGGAVAVLAVDRLLKEIGRLVRLIVLWPSR